MKTKIEKLFENLVKEKKIWRYNFSIGFVNGDVYGCNYENEELREKNEKRKTIK